MDNTHLPAVSQSSPPPPRRRYLQHKLPRSFTARNLPHRQHHPYAQQPSQYYSQQAPYNLKQDPYHHQHQPHQYHHHHQRQPNYGYEYDYPHPHTQTHHPQYGAPQVEALPIPAEPYVAPPGYPLSADLIPKSASNPMTPAEIDAKRFQDELADAQKGYFRPQRSRKCEQLLAERIKSVNISSDDSESNWTVTPEQLFHNRNRANSQPRRADSSIATAAAENNAPTAGTSGNEFRRRASASAHISSNAPQAEAAQKPRETQEMQAAQEAQDTQDTPSPETPEATEGGSAPLRRTATSMPTSPSPKLDVGSTPLRRAATAAVATSPPMYETYKPAGKPRVGISPLSSSFQRRMILSDYSPKPYRFKALLVGISYRGVEGKTELPGIRNDLREMYLLLVAKLGFLPENIRILSDLEIHAGETNKIEKPTLRNILAGMKWVSQEAKPGDSLFFFFAGHGDVVNDYSGDEGDTGYDQALVPWDVATANLLLDDVIFRELIRRIPHGVRLTCMIDACTSGTICDLPFLYTDKRPTNPNGYGNGNNEEREDKDMPPTYLHDPTQKAGESVLFSGAADLQSSVEIQETNKHPAFGVMTRAFVDIILELLEQNKRGYYPSFAQVLLAIEKQIQMILHTEGKRVQQDPQISSSHLFDIYGTPFSF